MSQALTFHSHSVRIHVENGQVMFVAKDVCAALGITWTSHTLDSIPHGWKGVVKLTTPSSGTRGGGNQRLRAINEAATYKLAFRSNKPEADAFTNWVASEVLPTIRKTGKYEAAPKVEPLTLPQAAVDAPDASKYHLRIREDLTMVLRIMDKLCCDSQFYLPQSGSWSQIEMLRRINASAGRVVKSLYEAKDHLRDANSLTLMLSRSAG